MSALSWRGQVLFRSHDDGYCVLDQTRSLEQQSTDALPEHIILFPCQLVFALIPQLSMLRGEAANANLIVIALNGPRFESIIYHTRREHASHTTPPMCKPPTSSGN